MTHSKIISNLCVGLEFAVVWAGSMAADKPTVFVFYWVLVCDVGVNYAPEVDIIDKGG